MKIQAQPEDMHLALRQAHEELEVMRLALRRVYEVNHMLATSVNEKVGQQISNALVTRQLVEALQDIEDILKEAKT
jgi:hypothetical protein